MKECTPLHLHPEVDSRRASRAVSVVCDDRSMSDRRRRRGPHPKDEACFGHESLAKVQHAVEDLSWMLERGYPARQSLSLVGDRFALRDRQRRALQRSAAGQSECRRRLERQVGAASLADEVVAVDGYNVLLTLEAALSGGVLLLARDETMRDLSSLSSHYRRVGTTAAAIRLLVTFFGHAGCRRVVFYLDRPIANGDRLCRLIESEVAASRPRWDVRLIEGVDQILAASPHVVATADSGILDRCDRWLNLARLVVEGSAAQ